MLCKAKHLSALIALSACIAQLNAAPYEFTERSNWHFSATGGMSFSTNSSHEIKGTDNSSANGEVRWNDGYAVSMAGGYTWNQWRFELEYAHRQLGIESADFQGLAGLPSNKGEITFHTIMINANYDWFLYERFFVYGGLGVGASFNRFKRR